MRVGRGEWGGIAFAIVFNPSFSHLNNSAARASSARTRDSPSDPQLPFISMALTADKIEELIALAGVASAAYRAPDGGSDSVMSARTAAVLPPFANAGYGCDLTVFEAGDGALQGYAAADGAGGVVIAFRGTYRGDTKTFVADILVDIDAVEVPANFGADAAAAQPRVHAGVREATERMWPAMEAWLDARTPAVGRVLLTGHSLGGAMATYATLLVHKRYAGAVAIKAVTFASPRVGDDAFVRCLVATGVDHTRVTNARAGDAHDPIPHLPPSLWKTSQVLYAYAGPATAIQEVDAVPVVRVVDPDPAPPPSVSALLSMLEAGVDFVDNVADFHPIDKEGTGYIPRLEAALAAAQLPHTTTELLEFQA